MDQEQQAGALEKLHHLYEITTAPAAHPLIIVNGGLDDEPSVAERELLALGHIYLGEFHRKIYANLRVFRHKDAEGPIVEVPIQLYPAFSSINAMEREVQGFARLGTGIQPDGRFVWVYGPGNRMKNLATRARRR